MEVGFKGTISAQFLKDLSQKTRRGLAAAVRDGRSGGGLPFGYRPTIDPGVFEIDEEKAEVVRRIFQMYADGYSPREIAGVLNKDGIPSPTGGTWNASTINGHRERGVGIIRNEIYVGVRAWNRTEKVRNPETGKKLVRVKGEEGIIRVDVPDLKILDQEIWEAVQARIPKRNSNKPYPKRQGYLLSGLLKCGECGGNFIVMGPRSHVMST